MNRAILCVLAPLLTGCLCQAPTFNRPISTGDVWDTTYLIDVDPNLQSIAALSSRARALNDHYWIYAQVDGVLWPPWRTDSALSAPDRWANGGDSGIYTGTALAAFSFQYKAERSDLALMHVWNTLRGLYILTHATGTPGVIQRNAFPADQPDKFGYPTEWASRIAKGFVSTGPTMTNPLDGNIIPPHTYYTRGTKDQLTGMVLGLAAAWTIIDPAEVDPDHVVLASRIRRVVVDITSAVAGHLYSHDWYIRDENGRNDTNADHVSGLLKAVVLGLVTKTGAFAAQEDYDKVFNKFALTIPALTISDRFSNFQQYYAHNLRVSRALAIWLIEGAGTPKAQKMADYIGTNVWANTKGHKNAWFAFARGLTTPSDTDAVAEGIYSLKSLSLKPIRGWASPYFGQEQKPDLGSVIKGCTALYVVDPHLRKPEDYSTWQKEPWDVGVGDGGGGWDTQGLGDASGLDFLLAYYLARAYNLIPE